MKAILLAKEHDITAFVSSDPARPNINGVHFNAAKNRLEATDGRILAVINVVESEEFPPVKGGETAQPLACIIPSLTLRKGLANIPKRHSLPILEHAKLDSNGKVTLTTTDLDNEQSVTGKPIDGQYPNVDAVIPKQDDYRAICLDANAVAVICEWAKKHGKVSRQQWQTQDIRFEIKDELSPVLFTVRSESGLELKGVLMPCRMS